MSHEHTKRIDAMAAKLALRIPFIATLFSAMNREITDEFPTAATNGLRVRFNPEFMDALSDEELLFVCAHEAMHVAFLHSYRRGARDPRIWNLAGDAIINAELLRSENGLTMPGGKYAGFTLPWVKPVMDSEYVYQKLMENAEKSPQDANGGFGDTGDLEDADGPNGGGDTEAEMQEVKVMVTQAAKVAFATGAKSALVERVLNIVRASNTDWKEETREMLSAACKNDYSYRRLARRFVAQGLYLPSLWGERLGTFVIGIDTSGSITSQQLDRIAADSKAIIEDCKPERVIVIYCDSSVNRVDVYEDGETADFRMCGGGGTAFSPVFREIEKRDITPVGMIYFTDLEGDYNLPDPGYPVLWGAVNASQSHIPPFGRRVEVPV